MRALRPRLCALAVALAIPASAEEHPPLELAPEEVRHADAGADAEASRAAPPQEEDREAAPIVRGAARPATATAPASSSPSMTKPPDGQPATPLAKPLEPERPRQARAPKAVAAATEPPPPAIPPRLSVHVYEPERGNHFEVEEAIEAAMGAVLAADARVRFVPLAALLEPPDEVAGALAAADEALAAAKKAYVERDLEHARPLVESALKAYQKHLPQLAARPSGVGPMRDGFIELSKVRFFDGNLEGARDALRYVFVLDGGARWNKLQFPPQMKKLVVESRLLWETSAMGKLEIDSDPQGASVWLNGVKLPGRTPTPPIDAPNGPNFISYARRGYAPMTQAFAVAGGGDVCHPLATLTRYPHNPLAPIDRARARIDESPAPSSLKEAAAQLGLDMLVLVRTSSSGERDDEPPLHLTGYLYDARSGRVIHRLDKNVESDLSTTARLLASELIHGVRLDGSWRPPLVAVRPSWNQRLWVDAKADWSRFRQWKGFWYVVGGVAGAAVIGTVAGAAAYGNTRSLAADAVILGGH